MNFSAAVAPQRVTLVHDSWPAPHAGRKLPNGRCAVYVFSLSEMYGRTVQAGAHRVLKVGKAGSNCNARFQSQHYNVNSAPSTLAGSLIRTNVLWHYLGIKSLDIAAHGAGSNRTRTETISISILVMGDCSVYWKNS